MHNNARTPIIHISRTVYAMSWYNIAPGLIFIQSDFNLSIEQLGILTTIFYVGVAIFQVPGGFIGTRFGNGNAAALGLCLLGFSGIFSAVSPGYTILLASRFMAGVGAAFFFSPAIGLLRSITSDRAYSFHINVFNGAFNVGAATGIFGWQFLDELVGWRDGFLIAGLITLAVAGIYYLSMRSVRDKSTPTARSDLVKATRNPYIWIFAVSALACVISENVVGQFLVYYMEKGLHYPSSVSSLSGTLFLLSGFAGGVLGGIIAHRYGVGVKSFILATSITGLLIIFLPFAGSLYAIYITVAILGMVTIEGFSIIYILISRNIAHSGHTAFSLSVVNLVQESVGSVWPAIFTFLKAGYSFEVAWFMMGASSLLFMLPLLLLKRITGTGTVHSSSRKSS